MKYFPRIRSKNHSLNALRRANRGLPALPVKSIIRFGSITPTSEVFRKPTKIQIVEINTVDAVRNSSSKLLMKEAFDKAEISHAKWQTLSKPLELEFPVVLKRIYGSKGRGMHLVHSKKELDEIQPQITSQGYIAEIFHNYNKEYRLHCTKGGCFYACRKMLKEDAEDRWYRNDSNCVWYVDTNPGFERPINWKEIESQCVKALSTVGLDAGAFDVRVQSAADKDGNSRKDPKFIIIEVNSAPAFGDITELKYKEILPQLIMSKANAKNN